MSFGQKFVYWILVIIWLVALVWFWQWWLSAGHIISLIGLLITSIVAGYQTIVPFWFFWFAGKAKRPNPRLPIPSGQVAMMTTKTPSEPWDIVQRTLEGMLSQDYPTPYDVWLADEDPSPETTIWCASHGVGITCRKGMSQFNRDRYPGQKKTKEGNTLSWYELVGYNSYDFVVQADADHAPANSQYLKKMIAPFINPKVGLVAAPSMCDYNADESWAVRGRFHTEATFHGMMQAGYSAYGASMGIGSHYAVRTKALKEAGGPGPTRAEDASTTLLINAAGYDSVFAIDAEAHGDGPGSFGSLASQEVQWSGSLMRILIEWTPKFWDLLSFPKKVIFGFSQGWYPSYGSHLLIGSFLPILAILFNTPWMNMSYLAFLFHWWILIIACLLPIIFIRSQGFFRPSNSPLISWEGILFQICRWPWVVIGCISGITSSIFRQSYTFHITPKGKDKERPLGFGVLAPYLFLILISAVAILFTGVSVLAIGYRWLAFIDIVLYAVVTLAIVVLHRKENRGHSVSFGTVISGLFSSLISVAVVVSVFLAIYPTIPSVLGYYQAEPTPQENFVVTGLRDSIGPTPTSSLEPAPIAPILEALIQTPPPVSYPVIELNTQVMVTGIYDPGEYFADSKFDIKHSFTDWNDPASLDEAIASAEKAGQFPLVTVQPFHKTGLTRSMLLQDVTAGKYDEQILAMAASLQKFAPQKVMIRWGHEMDLCTVYDWSNCAPPRLHSRLSVCNRFG